MKKSKIVCISILVFVLLTSCILPASADEIKKLYFEEKNGTMTWNTVRGSDGNWFMSFNNMVPGGHYTDSLLIENGSKKTYKLYVKAVPKQQSDKQTWLMEHISMKVSLDSEILYEGSASGKEYENGNLQNVVYLGTYKPKDSSCIKVDLELNKDIGIEYCDITAENDWKFMVTELNDPENIPQTIHSPKTGDTSDSALNIIIAACLLSILIILFIMRIKRKA